ncbi:hypothetical protein CEUSTIGMA_g1521.t1 [Chlamydomonas eustigma]|uniref:Uncharacterized protein n=1 Tax=Chlamydomonas eustigma TaxID=1157962 RepID=A0A250WTD5_9CHLO|nr:hypothetical protein CEUSTIGMA_g1521.t1 [Chlamydomonas eustigma]|eukprot:GAX74071.1 hypothetical protein CEUSTIGMA_g1521.t1 [Chlamydomonas eustigma]
MLKGDSILGLPLPSNPQYPQPLLEPPATLSPSPKPGSHPAPTGILSSSSQPSPTEAAPPPHLPHPLPRLVPPSSTPPLPLEPQLPAPHSPSLTHDGYDEDGVQVHETAGGGDAQSPEEDDKGIGVQAIEEEVGAIEDVAAASGSGEGFHSEISTSTMVADDVADDVEEEAIHIPNLPYQSLAVESQGLNDSLPEAPRLLADGTSCLKESSHLDEGTTPATEALPLAASAASGFTTELTLPQVLSCSPSITHISPHPLQIQAVLLPIREMQRPLRVTAQLPITPALVGDSSSTSSSRHADAAWNLQSHTNGMDHDPQPPQTPPLMSSSDEADLHTIKPSLLLALRRPPTFSVPASGLSENSKSLQNRGLAPSTHYVENIEQAADDVQNNSNAIKSR